jgi:hypothetical protein
MTQVQTLANEQPQEELVREVVYATILDVLSVSEIGAAVVAAAYMDISETDDRTTMTISRVCTM